MNEDRVLVRDHLEDYLKASEGFIAHSKQQIERTKRWANGEAIHAIAKSERVYTNAVAVPVKNLVKRVLEWHENNR